MLACSVLRSTSSTLLWFSMLSQWMPTQSSATQTNSASSEDPRTPPPPAVVCVYLHVIATEGWVGPKTGKTQNWMPALNELSVGANVSPLSSFRGIGHPTKGLF